MTTFAWYLQGTTPTEIDYSADDVLRFCGVSFSEGIFVGEYNDSTHVRTSGGSNKSGGNNPNNNKYISQAGGTGGDSQVQFNGGSTVDLDTLVDSEAALHIEISDSINFTISDIFIYSYDGVTPATPATGAIVRMAEVGDSNFTQAEGSGNALSLTDSLTPSMTHDFYVIISKSPSIISVIPDVIHIEGVMS